MLRYVLYVLLCFSSALMAESTPTYNRVSFSVSADEQVDSDLLVVRLFAQHQARQQAQAANRVNEDMAWALAQAKSLSKVRSETLDYRTNPVYKDGKVNGWQTRQSLRLESADRDALTGLLGDLQERLGIESVAYEISADVREAVEQRLIVAAIKRFGERAAQIQQSFGRQSYRLVDVNINTQGGHQPPIAYRGRAMAMQAEVVDPSLTSGQQALAVMVNGSIELSLD